MDGDGSGAPPPGPAEERPRAAPLNPRLAARLRRHPPGAPRATCADAPPAALRTAIEQFNQREFFECHETLEALWNAEPGSVRTLYKGILQVGVGCYHLLRHNYLGATVKLRAGANYLAPFAAGCLGVDVARLIADAHALLAVVELLGPERFTQADLALIPRVHHADDPPGA
jgi:predicted metal-dependent hydrolase